jgi:hypothetical protein
MELARIAQDHCLAFLIMAILAIAGIIGVAELPERRPRELLEELDS